MSIREVGLYRHCDNYGCMSKIIHGGCDSGDGVIVVLLMVVVVVLVLSLLLPLLLLPLLFLSSTLASAKCCYTVMKQNTTGRLE